MTDRREAEAARREALVRAANERYWRRSLRLVGVLLTIWFAVSFGCGILLREPLDAYTLPGTGFPLGFWFAQQGAIVTFVLLVAVYVVAAARLDAGLAEERNRIAFDVAGSTDVEGGGDGREEGGA
ncbi:MAG: DUF4212 domain-containing protein [Planctomycetota bacterium]